MSTRVKPSRDKILETAATVFAARGFEATPLRDLISASGCSTTAFYARFPSKDAVLGALLAEVLEELQTRAWERLPTARSIEEGYELGIESLLEVVRGRRGLFRVLLTEGAVAESTRNSLRDVYDSLARLLAEQLVATGNVGQDEAKARGWAIVGAVTMQLTRWAVFGAIDDEELDASLRGVARTLLPSSRPERRGRPTRER